MVQNDTFLSSNCKITIAFSRHQPMKGQRGRKVRFLSFRSENLCHRGFIHYGQNRLVPRAIFLSVEKFPFLCQKFGPKTFVFESKLSLRSESFCFRVETFSYRFFFLLKICKYFNPEKMQNSLIVITKSECSYRYSAGDIWFTNL